MICDGCSKEVDDKMEATAICFNHSKNFCWGCGETYMCIHGQRCRRGFIINPQWISRLKEIMNKEDQ